MDSELHKLLPDAPAGFRDYPVEQRHLGPYRWTMLRFLSRFVGSARTLWLSDGNGGKPYLIELVVQVYAGPKYAERMYAGNLPNAEAIVRLVDPPPTIITSPPNRLVIQWQRDSLRFTEISGVHANAVIAAESVASEQVDATPVIADLLYEIETRLDARGFAASGTISPRLWAWLMALPLGLVVFLAVSVGYAIGESVGLATFAVLAGVGLFSLSIWPRVLRRRSRRERIWRQGLTQGDSDGTIRRALASIGIELPEATPPTS